jgi:hypothetical protein
MFDAHKEFNYLTKDGKAMKATGCFKSLQYHFGGSIQQRKTS